MIIQTFTPGIFSANCYLIYDEKSKTGCLIDPGVYDAKISDFILSKDISLKYIILTHGHYDHILGANTFKEKTKAQIAAHELEAEYLEDPKKSFTKGETILADILFKENDVLTFGDISLRVLHTPGHTKGSCCIICDDEKVIFSGDTLFQAGIGRYDLYGGNYSDLKKSLQKIKSIGGNYKIYPGHGDYTTLDYEKNVNPYLN